MYIFKQSPLCIHMFFSLLILTANTIILFTKGIVAPNVKTRKGLSNKGCSNDCYNKIASVYRERKHNAFDNVEYFNYYSSKNNFDYDYSDESSGYSETYGSNFNNYNNMSTFFYRTIRTPVVCAYDDCILNFSRKNEIGTEHKTDDSIIPRTSLFDHNSFYLLKNDEQLINLFEKNVNTDLDYLEYKNKYPDMLSIEYYLKLWGISKSYIPAHVNNNGNEQIATKLLNNDNLCISEDNKKHLGNLNNLTHLKNINISINNYLELWRNELKNESDGLKISKNDILNSNHQNNVLNNNLHVDMNKMQDNENNETHTMDNKNDFCNFYSFKISQIIEKDSHAATSIQSPGIKRISLNVYDIITSKEFNEEIDNIVNIFKNDNNIDKMSLARRIFNYIKDEIDVVNYINIKIQKKTYSLKIFDIVAEMIFEKLYKINLQKDISSVAEDELHAYNSNSIAGYLSPIIIQDYSNNSYDNLLNNVDDVLRFNIKPIKNLPKGIANLPIDEEGDIVSLYKNYAKVDENGNTHLYILQNSKVFNVKGDGNCFYYSFILSIYDDLRDKSSDIYKIAFETKFTVDSYYCIWLKLNSSGFIRQLIIKSDNYIECIFSEAKSILDDCPSAKQLTNRDMLILTIWMRIILANCYIKGESNAWNYSNLVSILDITTDNMDNFIPSIVSQIIPYRQVESNTYKFINIEHADIVVLCEMFKLRVFILKHPDISKKIKGVLNNMPICMIIGDNMDWPVKVYCLYDENIEHYDSILLVSNMQ